MIDYIETADSRKYVPLNVDERFEIAIQYPYMIRKVADHKVIHDRFRSSGNVVVYLAQKEYKKHRLIADQFLPNPEGKNQVRFKDGNKHNLHVSNLEWYGSTKAERDTKIKKAKMTPKDKEVSRLQKALTNHLITQPEYDAYIKLL